MKGSPTSPSGFLSRQKGQAATSWGMWRGDVHSLHSPPPVQTKMISPKKRKRYLAPQTSTLGLKRYKMVKRNIGESGRPCRTCPPWTRSHCRVSRASAGWRSPHRRRSPAQHRLRSNLSSTNPDVGSSHQNRIMLLSWYWKARGWFLSILVTRYRSRSSRCHLI